MMTNPLRSTYRLATATVFQERLHCTDCSMDCCRMFQAQRGHGVAVGRDLPDGWIKCTPESTQTNVVPIESAEVTA